MNIGHDDSIVAPSGAIFVDETEMVLPIKTNQRGNTMSKLIHTKVNQVNISPHINNYSTRGIIHDTRKISNDPTCGRVKRMLLIALLAVMGSCPLSCGILSTANNSTHAVGSEVHFGVNVPDVPVLEIILKDGNDEVIEGGTEMDVTPTMAYAGFNTADVNVTVGTSSNGGYNLKMLVDNSSVVSQNNLSGINSNALVSAEGNTIETLGENPETPFTCSAATATTCNFTVNSWGYRLSTDAENTYKAVPQAETELLNYTDGATNGVTTSLGFGVRANAKQAGGYYETTLNFIATANPEEITIDSIRYMQDFAALTATEYANVVSSMDTSKTYTLYDSRDRETYTVQKLADGRIWMLDNLRLGSNEPTLLTKANTNIAEDYWVLPASVDSGFTNDASGRTVARINTDSKNVELEYADGKSNKVGTYYNYCAVSAGQICMDDNTGESTTVDICPAGWRLPTGGASGEYASLTNAVVGETGSFDDPVKYSTFKEAFHASLSGRFLDSSASNQGSYGYWWSSTYGNYSTNMYRLALDTLTVNPQDNGSRRGGSSVRCVLKPREMQYVTNTDLAGLMPNEGSVATLLDSRDNRQYLVGKLADGNYWMLDNLALDPSAQELNSSNTNVTSTVTTTFENKTSGWNTTSPNDAWGKAYFNLASKDTPVQYGNNSSNTTKVGGYYNYCAASAGTYCYASNASPANTNATSDICPAGWKMPNGDTAKGSYYYLFNTGYSGNKDNFKNALHAGYSGYFWDSSASNQGSSGYGYFWSATRYDGNGMYGLSVNASDVDPQDYYRRDLGFSVRCVLK